MEMSSSLIALISAEQKSKNFIKILKFEAFTIFVLNFSMVDIFVIRSINDFFIIIYHHLQT